MAEATGNDSDGVDDLVEGIEKLLLNVGFVTQSQKDKPQLFLNGYYFRINNYTGVKYNWRCTSKNCYGSCNTSGATVGQEYDVTIVNCDHNHAPDPIKLKKLEKRRKIKEKGKLYFML